MSSKLPKLSGAVVAVTLRCNARCIMCDLWQTTEMESMSPADYYRLPPILNDVNVSGGEPFLREDVHEIVTVIRNHCSKARITINTNGFLPRRIEQQVAKMPKGGLAIRISVDGLAEMHEEMRRIPNGFGKVIESLERLERLGIEDLGVAFTATKHNAEQILPVQRFAKSRGINFTMQAAHDSPMYFGEHPQMAPESRKVAPQIDEVIKESFRTANPRNWLRAYYFDGIVEHLDGKPRRLTCQAGKYFFYLDAYGNVYACNARSDLSMGNLKEQDWETIFANREDIWSQANQCHDCWMVCTVAPIVRRKPVVPALWALKRLVDTRVRDVLPSGKRSPGRLSTDNI